VERRFIQLFKILAKQKDYIKSEDLCHQLNIRPRTLREDIRLYKDTLEKDAGCKIVSKPNAGYCLTVFNDELYNEFIKLLLQEESKNQYIIPVHQEDRINYIIRYFLSHQDYIKLNDLADQIYVSRSTLNADIKEVKERFSYFSLQLTSKVGKGLKISGKEKDIRSCIAQYFYHVDNYDQQYMQNMGLHGGFIEKNAYEHIKSLLYNTISKYEFKLTDVGFQNLTIHILIAVSRILGNSYIEDIATPQDIFKDRLETEIAIYLANDLESYFNIKIPQSEIHYMTIHLMGKQALQYSENHLIIDEETTRLTEKILGEILRIFQIDLKSDLELYSMLTFHIQPLINRLKYGLKLSNPLTDQIKKDNPLAFEMAIVAGKILTESISDGITDDEISYLALHFALALERRHHTNKKNIIIVCASGAGSSQILLYKVKTRFRDYINEVLVTEAYKLPKVDQKKYDFILSTIPLPFSTDIPVIQVRYYLDEENIASLERVLIKNDKDASFIKNCFREEFFFSPIKAKTRVEAISIMCEKISQTIPLPHNFIELILEREKISSTEIGNRVATPHPIHLVMDDTFVAVGILDKPIKWDKQQVKFIFLLCIKKETDEAISIFNEVLSSFIIDNNHLLDLEKNPYFSTISKYIDSLSQEKFKTFNNSIFQ